MSRSWTPITASPGRAQTWPWPRRCCDRAARLLVHDVADWFPGVVAAVGALVRAGVLAELERVESLCAFEVVRRPRWLTVPAVDHGEQLPSPLDATSTPLTARVGKR